MGAPQFRYLDLSSESHAPGQIQVLKYQHGAVFELLQNIALHHQLPLQEHKGLSKGTNVDI